MLNIRWPAELRFLCELNDRANVFHYAAEIIRATCTMKSTGDCGVRQTDQHATLRSSHKMSKKCNHLSGHVSFILFSWPCSVGLEANYVFLF